MNEIRQQFLPISLSNISVVNGKVHPERFRTIYWFISAVNVKYLYAGRTEFIPNNYFAIKKINLTVELKFAHSIENWTAMSEHLSTNKQQPKNAPMHLTLSITSRFHLLSVFLSCSLLFLCSSDLSTFSSDIASSRRFRDLIAVVRAPNWPTEWRAERSPNQWKLIFFLISGSVLLCWLLLRFDFFTKWNQFIRSLAVRLIFVGFVIVALSVLSAHVTFGGELRCWLNASLYVPFLAFRLTETQKERFWITICSPLALMPINHSNVLAGRPLCWLQLTITIITH